MNSAAYAQHNAKLARSIPGAQRTIVSLRRNGDIINLLPLLRRLAIEGNRVRLVLHPDYAPLLEGVSYVEPLLWNGDMEDCLGAAKHFNAENAQTWGKGVTPAPNTNYAKAAWEKLGEAWDRYLPLVFDRRSPEREQTLAKSEFHTEKPKLLIKLSGLSSPFAGADKLRERITASLGQTAEIVDLDQLHAHRLYDLLGLMDRAAALLTVDTCTLWLAHASNVPTVALINGVPFLSSPPRGNSVLRVPYVNADSSWPEIERLLDCAVNPRPGNAGMVLVYSDWRPSDPETQARNAAALSTWNNLRARWLPFNGLVRNSSRVGDPRKVPYVKDMIEHAFATGRENIAVITNNDIRFDPHLRLAIEESCRAHGCYWAFRLNREGDTRTDEGADCFAVTRDWWRLHKHLLPDFLLGYHFWDDIMARVMRWSGCPEGPRLYYHPPHPGVTVRLNAPGNEYNVSLAKQWLKVHHENWDKPKVSSVSSVPSVHSVAVATPAKPKVWVFAICKDEAQMLPWFLRHYSTFADQIIIFDEQSTDGSRELIQACPKADLRGWPWKGLNDERFRWAINNFHMEAYGQVGWILWTDIDELLYHPDMLGMLARAKGDLIPSTGYALISPTGWPADDGQSQIYDLVKTGIRQDNYDKKTLWRSALKIEHTFGRHAMHGYPKHNGQECPDAGVKLFHLHHLGGVEDTRKRSQRCFDRATDKRFAWNYAPGANDDPNQNGSVAWVARAISENRLIDVTKP